MDESKLTAAALEHGLDVSKLTALYNANAERTLSDPQFKSHAHRPEFQQIDLDGAITLQVSRENGALGYSYALAFMRDDRDALEEIRNKISATPSRRWQKIHENVQQYIHSMSLQVGIPELTVKFADNNTIYHPTVSKEDRGLIHQLFSARYPHVEAVIEKNKGGTVKDWAANQDQFEEQHARVWKTENKAYEFPSLKEGAQAKRGDFDAGRGKSPFNRQPQPAGSLTL